MSMPQTSVRIAMLGSGFVAGFYMQGLANVRSQEVVANYSRKKHRARKFAQVAASSVCDRIAFA